MKKPALTILLASALVGCAGAPPEWVTGSPSCGYVGCEQGGLSFIPHEPQSAQRQPRREWNWEWGQTSSAYPPGSPEHERLKRQEMEHARSKGVDWMGRPLH